MGVDFLGRPHRQARRTEVVLYESTDGGQLPALGVAGDTTRARNETKARSEDTWMERQAGHVGALVVRDLGGVVADRTEGPFADGLGGGPVDVEYVTLGVVVLLVSRVELFVDRGGQVPAVLQVRQDQLRLEGPVVVAEVGVAVGA